jgi:aspartyl-tRNA(Asn)/glutamyl-tRNA(Gln) amidotransferase subunit A
LASQGIGMTDIPLSNAAELSAAYAARKLSPVEAARVLFDRIGKLGPSVNAFCFIDEAASMSEARASETRWTKGEPLSALDGVPVAIKDLLLTKGWPTLRGSRTVDPNQRWNEDAPAVARLREAGAVLLGKTTTPEFGWKGVTDSPLTGTTRNPWNLKMTPGGSSGGSAAALAARLAPLAIGTDGGGSIRIPASFSGLFGLKPSYGRVAAYPLSPFGTLAHVGPLSRDVMSSAMLLDVIARPDARDPHQLPPPGRSFTDGLKDGLRGRRVAFSRTMGLACRVDDEVGLLVEEAVHRLESLGARVEITDPPAYPTGDMKGDFAVLWSAGAGYLLGRASDKVKALLDPGFHAMVDEGAAISLRRYQDAVMARLQYASAMKQFMEKHDFLATPAVAVPAFAVGELSPWPEDDNWASWTPFTFPFNLTQQPAASVPCGFTRARLPVGLQIVGRTYDDWGVLAAAKAYEHAVPHFQKTPEGYG